MPANTVFGLPYPLPTEPVAEGAQAIRNLAETLDTVKRRIAKVGPLAAVSPTLDISGIAQGFTDLELVYHARCDAPIHIVEVGLRFNGDAAATYDYEVISANASSVGGAQAISATYIHVGGVAGTTESGNYWGTGKIFIPGYNRTDNRKQALGQSGKPSPNPSQIFLRQFTGAWRTLNAPITRVTLHTLSGNFGVGSWAALYGVP